MNGVKTEKVDWEYVVEVVGGGSKVLQCREIKASELKVEIHQQATFPLSLSLFRCNSKLWGIIPPVFTFGILVSAW